MPGGGDRDQRISFYNITITVQSSETNITYKLNRNTHTKTPVSLPSQKTKNCYKYSTVDFRQRICVGPVASGH